MGVEVTLANGSVKLIPSGGFHLYCPDCGGTPPDVWVRGYFRVPPRYSGRDFPTRIDRDSRSLEYEVVDISQIREFWSNLLEWRKALNVLQTLVPKVRKKAVVVRNTDLNMDLDRSTIWATLVAADPEKPYILDSERFSEVSSICYGIRSYAEGDPISLPSGIGGVCKQHNCFVESQPTPLDVKVDSSGVLTISQDDVLLFGSGSGQWACFIQTSDEIVESPKNDENS